MALTRPLTRGMTRRMTRRLSTPVIGDVLTNKNGSQVLTSKSGTALTRKLA